MYCLELHAVYSQMTPWGKCKDGGGTPFDNILFFL